MKYRVLLLSLALFLPNCTTTATKVTNVPQQEVISLKLSPGLGQVEVTSNCYVTSTKSFINGEIRAKKIETTDFKTQVTTIKTGKEIRQLIETIAKDGGASLHDLAYPELNEQIDLTLEPSGKVLKAGHYAKDSIFYIPALPLPDKPVKTGDQWEVENTWVESSAKLKLTSKIKSKFVEYTTCGDHQCVLIEFTGTMDAPEKLKKEMNFEHKLTGRFLFDPVLSLVPYAFFEADERLQEKGGQVVVKSRLRSILLQPPGYHTINREEQLCPSETMEE
jgi:hypothetical protein